MEGLIRRQRRRIDNKELGIYERKLKKQQNGQLKMGRSAAM